MNEQGFNLAFCLGRSSLEIGWLAAAQQKGEIVKRISWISRTCSAGYPCSNIGEAARGEVIVDSGGAVGLTEHSLEGARRVEPTEDIRSAPAQRVVTIPARTGAIAVERNRKRMNAKSGYR